MTYIAVSLMQDIITAVVCSSSEVFVLVFKGHNRHSMEVLMFGIKIRATARTQFVGSVNCTPTVASSLRRP